ncbi:MAG: MarR family winged helix-turn-helix transcriptional regulator [Terriglobia bacterium]
MAKSRQSSDGATLATLPCACSNLRRASRAVTQLYSQELRKVGLEPTQFTLLLALSRVGQMTQGSLATRHAIDSTTLTRTLAPLRKKGWIEAKPGADRREKLLRLTHAGRRQLRRALPHWQRAQRRLRGALGEVKWEPLQATITQVARAAQKA